MTRIADDPHVVSRALMRRGDYPLTPTSRQRWGNVVSMASNTSTGGVAGTTRRMATFVETPLFTEPRQWLIEVRVQNPLTGLWSPGLPSTVQGQLRITVRRATDRDKATVEDTYTLTTVGGAAPWTLGVVSAQQLGVKAEIAETNAGPVSALVEISVVPTECCDSLAVPDGVSDGYTDTATARYPATILAGAPGTIAANVLRAQLYAQNRSTSQMYIHFGAGISTTVGAEFASIILGPDEAYESPVGACYKGLTVFCWDVADAAGYGLITEGRYTV